MAQGGAPVVVGSPTNLTSGGTGGPDHGPASGTEELQEGGTALSGGVGFASPDNGDAPSDRSGQARRSAALADAVSQAAGSSAAPSGTTPWVANRHKAIRSFRASATTMTLRRRRAAPPRRSRNQHTTALPGW